MEVKLKNYRLTGKINVGTGSIAVDRILKANNQMQAKMKLFHAIKYSYLHASEKVLWKGIKKLKFEVI